MPYSCFRNGRCPWDIEAIFLPHLARLRTLLYFLHERDDLGSVIFFGALFDFGPCCCYDFESCD